jgi:hypothetical protein
VALTIATAWSSLAQSTPEVRPDAAVGGSGVTRSRVLAPADVSFIVVNGLHWSVAGRGLPVCSLIGAQHEFCWPAALSTVGRDPSATGSRELKGGRR